MKQTNKTAFKGTLLLAFAILTLSMVSAAPVFSDYQSNSPILTKQTAYFSVNVTPANATVWLQLNNINYTAANLSAYDIYNVSITGLGNATYTGFWGAYNNSGTRNTSMPYTITYIITEAPLTTSEATTSVCNSFISGVGGIGAYIPIFLGILGVVMVIGVITFLVFTVKSFKDGGEGIGFDINLVEVIGGIIIGTMILVVLSFAAFISLGGIC